MSIELRAVLRERLPLARILAHAEGLVAGLPGKPAMTALRLVEGSEPVETVCIGPFAIPSDQDLISEGVVVSGLGSLEISSGSIAKVALRTSCQHTDDQAEVAACAPVDVAYHVPGVYLARITMSVIRTRPSICLGAVLACSIATLNASYILDLEGRLGQCVDEVDPTVVQTLLRKHGDARTFQELSDRFCRELGDYSSWPL